MLDSWNQSIFGEIKQKLQDSAMRLVRAERNGEAFDSQLVIGVRESYGNKFFFIISLSSFNIHIIILKLSCIIIIIYYILIIYNLITLQ